MHVRSLSLSLLLVPLIAVLASGCSPLDGPILQWWNGASPQSGEELVRPASDEPNPARMQRLYGNRFLTTTRNQSLPIEHTRLKDLGPAAKAAVQACEKKRDMQSCSKVDQDCAEKTISYVDNMAPQFHDFAGMYMGYHEGDYLFVGFSEEPVAHFEELLEHHFEEPPCLRLFPVKYSLAELEEIVEQLGDDVLDATGAHSIGIDESSNAVVLKAVPKNVDGVREYLGDEYGDAVLVEEGAVATVTIGQ